jgi:hypothetical protein
MNDRRPRTDTGSSYPPVHKDRAAREAHIALLLVLPGLVIAMVLTGVWTTVVNAASPGGDEGTLVGDGVG